MGEGQLETGFFPGIGDCPKLKVSGILGWMSAWGVVALLASLVPWLLDETSYLLSGLAWTTLLVVAAWAIKHYRDAYALILRAFVELTALSESGRADEFVLKHFGRVYPKTARCLRGQKPRRLSLPFFAPLPMTLILLVAVVWGWTLVDLGSEYDTLVAEIALYAFFVPIVIAGMWGASIVVSVVLAFAKATKSGLRVPFSVSRHPTFKKMEWFWERIGGAVIVIWSLLWAAFATGPHDVEGAIQYWLLFLALFPLFWFGYGSWEFRRIYKSVKDQHLEMVSRRTQHLAPTLSDTSSSRLLRDLGTAVEIEATVQATRVWPSAFNVGGLAISAAPVVLQVALLIAGGDASP